VSLIIPNIESKKAIPTDNKKSHGSLLYFLSSHFPMTMARSIGPIIQPESFVNSTKLGCHHGASLWLFLFSILIRMGAFAFRFGFPSERYSHACNLYVIVSQNTKKVNPVENRTNYFF
jgi:hypothetical protein